jgi:phosphoglycolate phosphatase
LVIRPLIWKMARAAKLRALGVAWGYHTPDRLLAAGAHQVANSVRELGSYLRNLLNEHGR